MWPDEGDSGKRPKGARSEPKASEDQMVKLAIDFEFSSRQWWENGGQELWDAVTEGFDGSGVVVDDDLASSWLERARTIPGWDDGAEYAPHPIRASALDEDDIELG